MECETYFGYNSDTKQAKYLHRSSKSGIEDFCYLCKNGVITNLFVPYTATLSALHHSCARCTFLVINTQSRKAAKRSPASKTNASWLPLAVASAK